MADSASKTATSAPAGSDSSKTKKSLAYSSLFSIMAAAFLWGVDGVLLRPSLYHLSPATVVFVEHCLAFGLILVFVLGVLLIKKGRFPAWLDKDWQSIKALSKKGWLIVFWIALFGGLLGTFAITKALFFVHFVPLSIPIFVQKLQPLIAVIFARLLLKEKIKKHFYYWLLVALAGSYLLTFGFNKPVFSLDNLAFVAALLGLLAAFSWGSSTVFSRWAVMEKLTYRAAVFLRFGLTSVLAFVIMFFTAGAASVLMINQSQWLTLLIVALSTGLLASLLYYKGLKKVPAHLSTLAELVFPITVIVGDYLLNGQVVSLPQLLGAGLIFISIWKSKK